MEPFKHANLEGKIDLMMSAMMKVHKTLHDKIESLNEKNFHEEDGLVDKIRFYKIQSKISAQILILLPSQW